MKNIQKVFFLLITLIFFTILIACSDAISDTSDGSNSQTSEDTEHKDDQATGGELNIAYNAQANTLDPHMTTAQSTRDISRHIYETLVSLDSDYKVAPVLAESYEESDDKTSITFYLREGVLFHDGTEMTAEDVVASMNRWLENSTQAKANLGGSSFKEIDKYTVEMELEKPNFVALYILADVGQFAAIMPKNIIEDASPEGVSEYIGTGPFKFEEWRQDQYVLLTKFEDYQSVSEPASGLVGSKEALVDSLYFRLVPDASTRVAGILSGEYDVAMQIPYDSVELLENQSGVYIETYPDGWNAFVFNKQEGVFTDKTMRHAVAAAVNAEEILQAAYTNENFYELDPATLLPDQVDWYSTAGEEFYNQNNPDKAKELIEEAGYDGEEIIILVSRDYEDMYNAAVVLQEQLENVGMNVKLDVYDWPTLLDKRDDPSAYDIFVTNMALRATLTQAQWLNSQSGWAGWTNSPELDYEINAIYESSTQEEARKHIEKLQQLSWEYLPVLKTGNINAVIAAREEVEGFENLIGPIFWNTSNSSAN